MKVKAGDQITFRGVAWNEGWEFGAPVIVYTPIPRYGDDSICGAAIEGVVEDICIDLSLGDDLAETWSKSALKEFSWRGWNPKRFGKRKKAIHAAFTVTFFQGKDGLEFEIKKPDHPDPEQEAPQR